jgi:hypothetical protein
VEQIISLALCQMHQKFMLEFKKFQSFVQLEGSELSYSTGNPNCNEHVALYLKFMNSKKKDTRQPMSKTILTLHFQGDHYYGGDWNRYGNGYREGDRHPDWNYGRGSDWGRGDRGSNW